MAFTTNKPKSTRVKRNHLNVRKGDNVKIITGKDAGKEGEILRTIPETERVVVKGLNMMKKTLRPTQANPQGGINTMEAPLAVSNVMLVCPKCNKPTRVGHHIKDDGTKVRACKKCGQDID